GAAAGRKAHRGGSRESAGAADDAGPLDAVAAGADSGTDPQPRAQERQAAVAAVADEDRAGLSLSHAVSRPGCRARVSAGACPFARGEPSSVRSGFLPSITIALCGLCAMPTALRGHAPNRRSLRLARTVRS